MIAAAVAAAGLNFSVRAGRTVQLVSRLRRVGRKKILIDLKERATSAAAKM